MFWLRALGTILFVALACAVLFPLCVPLVAPIHLRSGAHFVHIETVRVKKGDQFEFVYDEEGALRVVPYDGPWVMGLGRLGPRTPANRSEVQLGELRYFVGWE